MYLWMKISFYYIIVYVNYNLYALCYKSWKYQEEFSCLRDFERVMKNLSYIIIILIRYAHNHIILCI